MLWLAGALVAFGMLASFVAVAWITKQSLPKGGIDESALKSMQRDLNLLTKNAQRDALILTQIRSFNGGDGGSDVPLLRFLAGIRQTCGGLAAKQEELSRRFDTLKSQQASTVLDNNAARGRPETASGGTIHGQTPVRGYSEPTVPPPGAAVNEAERYGRGASQQSAASEDRYSQAVKAESREIRLDDIARSFYSGASSSYPGRSFVDIRNAANSHGWTVYEVKATPGAHAWVKTMNDYQDSVNVFVFVESGNDMLRFQWFFDPSGESPSNGTELLIDSVVRPAHFLIPQSQIQAFLNGTGGFSDGNFTKSYVQERGVVKLG